MFKNFVSLLFGRASYLFRVSTSSVGPIQPHWHNGNRRLFTCG